MKRDTGTVQSMDAVTHQAVRAQHLQMAFFMARNICRGRWGLRQLGGFLVVAVIVALFVPTECPVGGGGYVGYIRKALEKGYLEHPGSACCTDDMFEIFVRFGRACVPCCLFLSTGS